MSLEPMRTPGKARSSEPAVGSVNVYVPLEREGRIVTVCRPLAAFTRPFHVSVGTYVLLWVPSEKYAVASTWPAYMQSSSLMTLRSGLSCRQEWTREGILEAARAWDELYAGSPSDTTWSPTALRKRSRSDEMERFLSEKPQASAPAVLV